MRKILYIFIFLPLILSFTFRKENALLRKLDGDVVHYNNLLRDSDKTVFFFWTSSCYYCRRELKKLNKDTLAGEKDLKIYYINLGEDKYIVDRISESLNLKEAIRENILLDEEAWFVDRFNLIGVPTVILFKKGREVYRTNYLTKEIIRKYFRHE